MTSSAFLVQKPAQKPDSTRLTDWKYLRLLLPASPPSPRCRLPCLSLPISTIKFSKAGPEDIDDGMRYTGKPDL